MNKRLNQVAKTIAASLLLASGLSQAAEEGNWYQAEVIIFKRLSHNQTELAIDPNRLKLSYPEKQAFIVDQGFMQDEAKRLSDEAEAQANGTALSDDNADNSEPNQTGKPQADNRFSQFPQNPLPVDPATAPPAKAKAAGDFYLELEQAKQILADKAKALSLSRNQRVLFHKSWNQQLGERQSAPAIIVNGGEAYDEHTELEGYIRLSRSRYLHIDANIWLSRFSPTMPGEVGNWPQLPETPLRHRIEQSFDAGADNSFHYQAQEDVIQANSSSVLQTGELDQDTRPDPQQLQQDLMAHDLAQQQHVEQSGYHVDEIQYINQSRRMRSGELHYIDHPAFGIIVQLVPIEAPQWPYNNQVQEPQTDQAASAESPAPDSPQ